MENNVARCPHCEATQADAPDVQPQTKPGLPVSQPRVNTQTAPASQRNCAQQVLEDLVDFVGLAGPLALPILLLPLAVVVAIGYIAAGQTGAAVSLVLTAVLLFALAVWSRARS